MVDAIIAEAINQKTMVLAPLVTNRTGAHKQLLERIAKEGFVRVRVNGEVMSIEDVGPLNARRKHSIDVVVDRLTVREEHASRLADSIQTASNLSGGRVAIAPLSPDQSLVERAFSASLACPNHPEVRIDELSPRLFSFNSPYGACPTCDGLGITLEFDPELLIPDEDLTLDAGAVAAWRNQGRRLNALYSQLLREFCDSFDVRSDVPVRNLPEDRRRILLDGTTSEDEKTHGHRFEGVIPNLQRRWETTDSEALKQRLHGFLSEAPCEACGGSRLRAEALAVRVAQYNVGSLTSMTIAQARRCFDELHLDGEAAHIAEPLLRGLRERLRFLCDVGVEYLSLDRATATLSGGEGQRIRLATQIGSGLAGVSYVLDEPTCGLHPRDSQRLADILKRLSSLDNTVIVVEHDEQIIQAADHLIDVGPGAGHEGGNIVYEGRLPELLEHEKSHTGAYLSGRTEIPLPEQRRKAKPDWFVEIKGAAANNLQNIDVRFPLGLFIAVTGVSGSGKSTLVNQILLRVLQRRLKRSGPRPGEFYRIVGSNHIDAVVEVDQTPIGRTPRSTPATYVGVFDLIRRLFAKTREAKLRGYTPPRFSFNVRGGRCEHCQGQGIKRIEMHFLPDVYVTCQECSGTRYNRETLEVRYRGKSIADVLSMRVEEAVRFFDSFANIRQRLQALKDVGLGYIKLGQSSNTLSGGEAQRVKLAAELQKSPEGHTLYVLDEPTTGLHFADVRRLLAVLDRLVDRDNTVLVIEHNLDVIKTADWIIDLGPDGGEGGGRIVAEGTPEQLADHPESVTGRYLADRLKSGAAIITAP
jgi:excinuclease ABC subunit A